MRPTRILGIAPYEGMRSLMVNIAQSMPDVEMTAFVGDLEPGATIASHYTSNTIDVILSRGGTAELIRKHTTLPVIEIELSVYDILRSLKLAENSSNRFAVVGFPAITQSAAFLSEILQRDIDLHTIHNTEEAREVLHNLSTRGYSAVLCDMITNSLAREYELPAILITSGRESIQAAIRQAVHLGHTIFHVQSYAQLMEKALDTQVEHLALRNAAGQAVYTHHHAPLPPAVQEAFDTLSMHADTDTPLTRMLTCQQSLWALKVQTLKYDGESYTVLTARETHPEINLEAHGIRFYDKEETYDRFYHSFYGITQSSHLGASMEEYARSTSPLMIVGEPGTGKDQMVRLLYAKSALSCAPLCVINCAMLNAQGWDYLLHAGSSPLVSEPITLHFQGILSLSDQQFVQLCAALQDVESAGRNRFIFTASVEANGNLHPRYQKLLSLFNCITITMPPLRSRKNDIPYLASLYISTLNLSETREIAGFQPEALQQLQQYDWPVNHDQFVRVLRQLVQLTHTPYISPEDTQEVLTQERQLYAVPASSSIAQLIGHKSLDEINQIIVQYVLAQEQGNQKATALRLGISRSTLWRMLQRIKGNN